MAFSSGVPSNRNLLATKTTQKALIQPAWEVPHPDGDSTHFFRGRKQTFGGKLPVYHPAPGGVFAESAEGPGGPAYAKTKWHAVMQSRFGKLGYTFDYPERTTTRTKARVLSTKKRYSATL